MGSINSMRVLKSSGETVLLIPQPRPLPSTICLPSANDILGSPIPPAESPEMGSLTLPSPLGIPAMSEILTDIDKTTTKMLLFYSSCVKQRSKAWHPCVTVKAKSHLAFMNEHSNVTCIKLIHSMIQ